MTNLINAITSEEKSRLQDFINSINEVSDIKVLTQPYGFYSDLIPKGKDVSKFTLPALRAYLITRKEKSIYKAIERKVNRIKTIFEAGELIEVKVSIEWKKSRMWGSNPKAEGWCVFKDKTGNTNSHYVTSGSIGGCGYDKQSTAVAEVLNQFNEVLKPLYQLKNNAIATNNRDLLGYGSGYGILPSFEGGVGVSCYPRIFEKIGFEFRTVVSGKTYDVYEIRKIA